MRWRADRGSATVWMLGLAAMVVAMTQLAVARGSAVLARHRLERAADLSALAAATEIGRSGQPCLAAGRVAAENGAQLVTCLLRLDPSGRSGTVAVSLSRSVTLPLAGNHLVVARARAGRLPAAADTGPPAAAGTGRPAVAATAHWHRPGSARIASAPGPFLSCSAGVRGVLV